MKKWMKRIHKTCLVPVIVLAAMLFFLLAKGMESAYTITLWEGKIAPAPSGQVEMLLSGGNLLRINSFYIGGERIEDCAVEKMTYDTCRITFDPAAFSEGNTWYEIRVGYHKWGFIDLLSSPIWVEWTGS